MELRAQKITNASILANYNLSLLNAMVRKISFHSEEEKKDDSSYIMRSNRFGGTK
jgi:hypothetical protein